MSTQPKTTTRIVRIGNSQGIRVPKPLLEQAGLARGDAVEIEIREEALVVRPARRMREGWAERFAEMAESRDDTLIDEETPTRFDREEWEW